MGSNWFSRCDLDGRFTYSQPFPHEKGGNSWLVYDWDQRRCIDVHVPKSVGGEVLPEAVEKFIDTLPADHVIAEITKDGSLVSSSPDDDGDRSWIPFYPPRTDFPRRVSTIRRRDLTEIDRLGIQVDLTTYSPAPGETRKVVFKYYVSETNVALWWHEANCVMRMPKHPNIVPFDSLVVDKVDGIDRVVGFTTQYIPGGTLSEDMDRVFELKYLEQLIKVVDHLNLGVGIVHGDICPWNLLIDGKTDNIQLFDFNCAAKLGWDGDQENRHEFQYAKDRNDIKFVIFTVYELITREFCFRREFYPHELDASKIMGKRKWVQHKDAQLDSPVEEYRRVLKEWAKRRAETDKEVDHFTKASTPLSWPPLRVDEFMSYDRSPLRKRGRMRSTLTTLGMDFLSWVRPPTRSLPLPEGQRLLATGEVVQDAK
ncbi:kinase-like domain-containing protein [Chaetomidium leptoderma]|uniref:EKC/KEOPS complex subunit BUD32 n=1 Tax=Chaetomidium leptoderma TaxID=669021 RepID=A0AAN6VFP0_9PEZI|nr:kinase-like domain-containing protein [Chaetomidium leptoderma]